MYGIEERKKCLLDQTELFVIDMDGTFYCEEKMIDGALDFESGGETGKAVSVFHKQHVKGAGRVHRKASPHGLRYKQITD